MKWTRCIPCVLHSRIVVFVDWLLIGGDVCTLIAYQIAYIFQLISHFVPDCLQIIEGPMNQDAFVAGGRNAFNGTWIWSTSTNFLPIHSHPFIQTVSLREYWCFEFSSTCFHFHHCFANFVHLQTSHTDQNTLLHVILLKTFNMIQLVWSNFCVCCLLNASTSKFRWRLFIKWEKYFFDTVSCIPCIKEKKNICCHLCVNSFWQ